MAEHPKVFISYSHDSAAHRQWVLELGTKLRHKGIDVVLDRWDLTPGDNFTHFMEAGVRDLNWALVICTDNYVKRANDRKGGVGYEVQIVTAQLVDNLGIDKFIPIIRHTSEQEKMPTFLGGRVYIDFTDDSRFNEKFDDLLHKLYEVPVVEKPPLGEKPSFIKQEVSPIEGSDTQLPEIPEQVESAFDAYSVAIKLAEAENVLGWHQLVKRIKSNTFKSLVQRRQEGLVGETPTDEEKLETVDEAVGIISPVISVALAGVESKMEQFRDQKFILEDLLDTVGRRVAGPVVWGDIAFALGYVYHSLHGGISLFTNQLDLALSLAWVKIPGLYTIDRLHVWKRRELMGWSAPLGDDCTKSWKYLAKACDRWKWLAPIFGDESRYRTSLVAYYMALNIHELASRIASGQQDTSNNVPLTFLSEDYSIIQRAITMLRNQKEPTQLWTCLNVTREQMEDSWENWISASDKRWGMYEGQLNSRIHHNLTHIFRYFFEGL